MGTGKKLKQTVRSGETNSQTDNASDLELIAIRIRIAKAKLKISVNNYE